MKIGFVSDIHEDIKSLEKAFEILQTKKCDKIVCLGDFVGYVVPYFGFLSSRNSLEVIKIIREKCEIIVAGNHDLFAIKKLPEYKAGFEYPHDWYFLDYWERKRLSQNKVHLYEDNELSALLTEENKKFIEKIPEFFVAEFDGIKIFLSHYAYPDLVGTKIFETKIVDDVKEHFRFMKKFGCNLGISGHDHKEGLMKFAGDKVENLSFGKIKIDKEVSTWIHGPSVVNGSFANGVIMFDTLSYELESIPLNSKKHIPPEWRNL